MHTQLTNRFLVSISKTRSKTCYFSMSIKSAFLAVLLLLPASVFCQVPGVIGVKFAFGASASYAVTTDLAPTDAAGVLVDDVLAVTNWNDLLIEDASDLSATENVSWPIAQDSAGNALSGVTVTPAGFNDGWYAGGSDCANARLLEAFWKINLGDTNAGVGKTPDGNTYATLTISNLPASEYDVYVYVNDNNGNYWGNMGANSVFALGTNIDNAGFNGDETDPCSSTPQLHTATGYGNPVNYMEMPAVATTTGGVITITIASQGGNDMGIPGFELIPTGTVVASGPPIVTAPTESPTDASVAVVAGQSVTLSDFAVGAIPLSYQWQTDGGSGNTPTNIPGAINTNLAVNTTGFAAGTYVYDVVAANSAGTNAGATVNIVVAAVYAAEPAISVQFVGSGQGSETLATGQVAGFVPEQFWNLANGATPNTASNLVDNTGAPTAASVTVTYANGQYGSSDNEGTPDGILMSGGFWSGGGYTIAATGIPYASYDVFLYMLNDDNPNRRYGFTLGTQTYWGSVFDGNGYSVPPYTLDTETEELAEGTQMQATLVEFTNITGTNFTIAGVTPDGNVALMGMEIFNAFVGPAVAAPITLSPTNTIYPGVPFSLSELPTSGALPITFQWLTDGGTGGTLTNIVGATNSTLPVNTSTFAPGNFNYEVIVSNSAGSSTSPELTVNVATSAPLLVTDITPGPLVEVPDSPMEAYVGQTVTYSATFVGTLPIAYQWMLNTGAGATPISAASNPSAVTSTLVLSNIQLASAGTYTLDVSNTLGTNESSSSTLAVLTDLPAPAAGNFAALELGDGPVAYWRLNETEDPSTGDLPAYDASGHNFDGVYGAYSLDDVPGPQPSSGFPGFEANNTALQTANDVAPAATYVTVPPLNLNTNTVTVTMWIDPSAVQIVDNGLFKWQNELDTDAAGLAFGGTVNSSGMPALNYSWNSNSAATYGWNSGLFPLENQWSFVALVITPANATIYLYYIDPITALPDLYSAVNPLTNIDESFDGGTTLIGSDPYSPYGRSFTGSIDEVAVFNQALTSDQILAMFSKAASLGAVAPQISGQPESIGTFVSKTVSFSVGGVNGTSPFGFQWQHITATATNNLTDGGNIYGATTTTLTISNATAANAGSYQLVVTNSVGTAVSSNAALVFVTPAAGSYEAAVLQYNPFAYWPLNETNPDPTNGGAFALEYINEYTGTYQIGANDGFNGVVGPESPAFPGFPAVNTALETFINTKSCYVSASAGSLIATNLTYTMWINPSGPAENWAGLLIDRGSPTTGTGFGFGGDTNASGMSELAYTWNQNNADTYNFNTLLYPATNEWSLVAMVVEPSQGTVYLIGTNGVVQSTNNVIPHDSEEFAVAWHIGEDYSSGANDGSRVFPGRISGVAVFLSALSAYQIQTLADAGLGITPPPPPVTVDIATNSTPGSLTISWSSGTLLEATNLGGPWTTNTSATSPYPVSATNSHMFFKILAN
jgi:hypothetical protein